MLNKLRRKIRLRYAYQVAKSLFISQYALMLEYRAEIALWAISGMLPLIMLTLWTEINTNEAIFENTTSLTRYFISAFIVRQFTAVWVMISFEEDNIEGKLSPLLLQPITPFWRYISTHIAEQITRLPFVIIMLCLLFIFIPEQLWIPGPITIVLFIFATFLAFLVRFLIHWITAMACFWNERASAIERLLLIPYIFLSGLIAPLESFPPTVYKLAMLTPYPYLLSFPAKLLAGQSENTILGFETLIIWALVLCFISIYCWRKGIKYYSAMGA